MLYAVYRVGKKVRWKSLKTQDIAVARERANIGIRFKHQAERVTRAFAEANDIDLSVPPLPPSSAPAQTQAPKSAPQPRPKPASHTLAEAWEAWKRTWAIAQGTRATREAHWKMLGRVLKPETALSDLNIVRLKEVQAALKESGLSPVSVNDVMFKSLKRALENAVDAGWLPENPAAKLKPLKKKAVIRQQPTWEEAWKLVEDANKISPESGEILNFMLSFGVGQAETKNLKGEHFDFQRGEVKFVRQKTGKPFEVPIFEHAKPLIESLKVAGRIQTGKLVFGGATPNKPSTVPASASSCPFARPGHSGARTSSIAWRKASTLGPWRSGKGIGTAS